MTGQPPIPDLERITALLIGRVGDVIIATPALRALRQRFPRARIRLVLHSQCRGLIPLIPFCDEFLTLERFPGLFGNMALIKALRQPHGLFIDLNPSFSRTADALTRLAAADDKLGFDKGPKSALTRRIDAVGEREHMLDRYARLAQALEAPYEPRTELRLTTEDERQADRILPARPDAGRKRVLVHAGNFKKFDNRWPEEKFVALTDALLGDPRLEIFHLAGPGEERPVRSIVDALKRPVPVLSPSSIGMAGALMRRMDAVLLNITGTTHLAAALDVPTFGLYAGYTDAVWRPRHARHGGVVAGSWDSCRSIPVEAVLQGFRAFLGL
jgi:ADP-heptose:LPS heptosyltransferase